MLQVFAYGGKYRNDGQRLAFFDYGVLSFLTSQRTREIGRRIAMGAQRTDILRMVVGEGMAMVGAGIVVGGVAAFAVTRVMTALLYRVSATDPLTLVATTLLLAVVALVACYLPAQRATRLDPLAALRSE